MLLYAVTDRAWLDGKSLCEQVEQSILGGITFLQLREKELDDEEFLKEAIEIKALANKYAIPFVINDNIDIALKCNADGVHVGQTDMEAGKVRKLIGDDKIIGVSVQTVEEAILAEKNGADYLGVGAMFSTSTKQDASLVTFEDLKNICSSVSIPVVAIGGINETNLSMLRGTMIDGVAIVSAIYSKKNIAQATQELHSILKEIIK
jgi:thiamine-phosphate pyrophosphorylase